MKKLSPDFFMLTGEQDFLCRSKRISYDIPQQSVRLTRNDKLRLPECDKQTANQLLLNHQPALCDANKQLAWISADGQRLLTGSIIDDETGESVRVSAIGNSGDSQENLELQPVMAPTDTHFVDLAMWERCIALCWTDDVNHHGVDVIELGSKRHYSLDSLDSSPEKIWLDRQKRIWVVDSDNSLIMCEGEPLPQPWNPAADIFKPLNDNPAPFSVVKSIQLKQSESVLSLCSDEDYLYLLTENQIVRIELDSPQSEQKVFTLDAEIPYVTDCRVMPSGHIALWVPTELEQVRVPQDCPLVALDEETETALLVKERYPRRRLAHNAFLANPSSSAMYLSAQHVLELTGLPQVSYHKSAFSILQKKLDSRISDTLWDRISFDACIPSGCKIRLRIRAYDHPSERQNRNWHDQGQAVKSSLESRASNASSSIWELVIRKEKNQGRVREIRGRYLEIKLQLESNGMATPIVFCSDLASSTFMAGTISTRIYASG